MSQVSYGTITITDTNDIESITIEYARNQSTSNPPDSQTGGWSTTRPAWAQGYYIWQRARIHKSGTDASADTFGAAVCLTGSTGQTGGTGAAGRSLTGTTTQYTTAASNVTITQDNMGSYTWSNNVPAYNSSTPAYWVRVTNTYSNPSSTEYIFYKDQGITDAIKTSNDANTTANSANTKADNAVNTANSANTTATNAYNIATGINQHFWTIATDYATGLPAGSYITDTAIDTFKSQKTGGNILTRSDGIWIRNGIKTLTSLTGTALTFYNPSTNNAQLIIGANGTLQSGNYTRGSDSKFSNNGTKIDLINGDIITKYFRVSQGLESGLTAGVYVHGTIEALDGTIGTDSTNYWEIGNGIDYNLNSTAKMIGHGSSYIQLGDSSTWRLATNRIHTGWYTSSDSLLHFPTISSKYWDFGVHSPSSATDKFLYIRSSKANTSASNVLQNLLYDIDDAYATPQWDYKFYIDGSGNLYAKNLYFFDDNGNPVQVGGADGAYLPKTGGTISGNLEVNGTLTKGSKNVAYLSATPTSGQILVADGTSGGIKTSGFTIATSVPSGALFTDKYVQTSQANTTKIYLTGTSTAATNTGTLNFDSNVYLTTTAGTLHATIFEGNLSGTASRATADGDGNTIKTTYLKLSGGNVTGAVTFGSSVSIDELTVGDLVVNGAASFTNNAQFNTINGVAVGSSPKFTDTTYSSLSAASGGTAVSLVTTGEKYTWNNKQDKLTNPVTGTGTNGYLTKWTGTNTIGNGPALGTDTTKFLNNKGEWAVPTGTYTYTLPLAANGTRGGVQIGYTQSGKNYPVQLSSEKMYVNVPWENTTYSAGTGLSLSGTTFSNSGVIGIKGNAESSYRTGQVNLTPNNLGAVGKNDELLTTNPFRPASLSGPYISKIDNGFYAADKRWNISMTNISGSVSNLFDGSYETEVTVTAGTTSVLTMDFTPTTYFPGYPYGYILVSFYHTGIPTSVSGRVYCNYESHGIGWHNISFSPISDSGTSSMVYRSEHQGYYNISKLEISIVGASNPTTKVTQVEIHLDRPDSSRTPFLSKYGAETLYYDLTAPNFKGNLTGNVTGNVTGTAANVTGTVAIANGGTGQTTAANAINALLGGLPVWSAVATDSTYFIRQDTGGSASYGKVPFSTLWSYISGKLPAWSQATNKPSYTFSELTSHPTTLNGYGITDAAGLNAIVGLSASSNAQGITTFTATRASGTDPLSFEVSITASSATGATKLKDSNGDISLGAADHPVYFSGGVPAQAYYIPKLNGNNQSSAASFYAPTSGGTANTQALVGNGASAAPKWVNISPSISITAGTSSATPKINVTVLGQSGTAQSITTASTSVYGATKLSSTSSSSEQGLAATPKLVYDSIAALDGNLNNTTPGAGKTLTAFSQTDGKISATFSDISITKSQISDFPTSMTPAAHTHDDRYYTETEIDNRFKKYIPFSHYSNTNGGNSGKYYKISINSYTGWMLNFTVKLYHAYRAFDLQISGYNYGSSHWYSPAAVVLGASVTEAIEVNFGYDSDYHLWIAIPAQQYTGIGVTSFTNGYLQVDSWEDLFTITMVDGMPTTKQSTVTAYRPWYRDETVTNATNATNAETAAVANSVAWSNVTSKPINFITNVGSLDANGWKTLGGRASQKSIAISYASSSPATWNSEAYSSSIVFGCNDTKGMVDIGYSSSIVTFGGGSVNGSTDNAPKWYFKLSGTSGQTYTFPNTSKTLVATDGTGASGTWGISISGNAATASKITNLTSSDSASATDTWRNIWISYNDNVTGRPAITNSLVYQTSTNTLKAPHFLAEHTNGGQNEFRVTYGSTVDMAMMIGTGNENHGLYDSKAGKWMIYADGSGNVSVNGNAATATSATSATKDSAGNTISTTYVKKAGDTMSGALCFNVTNSSSNFEEGIRINKANSGYASLVMGGAVNSVNGITDSAYWLGVKDRRLYIAHNGGSNCGTYFYASSSSQINPNLRLPSSGSITSGNVDAVNGGTVYTALGSYVTLDTNQTLAVTGTKTYLGLQTYGTNGVALGVTNGTSVTQKANMKYDSTLDAIVFSFA